MFGYYTTHLSQKRNGLLTHRMAIADVGSNDLVERFFGALRYGVRKTEIELVKLQLVQLIKWRVASHHTNRLLMGNVGRGKRVNTCYNNLLFDLGKLIELFNLICDFLPENQ